VLNLPLTVVKLHDGKPAFVQPRCPRSFCDGDLLFLGSHDREWGFRPQRYLASPLSNGIPLPQTFYLVTCSACGCLWTARTEERAT
jgi:hypothetical protein